MEANEHIIGSENEIISDLNEQRLADTIIDDFENKGENRATIIPSSPSSDSLELHNSNPDIHIDEGNEEKVDDINFHTAINDFMGYNESIYDPTAPIEPVNVDNSTISIIRASTVVPADIRQLTIKNLDTGEEFIIGENDPDFDFDTFELCAGPHHEKNKVTGVSIDPVKGAEMKISATPVPVIDDHHETIIQSSESTTNHQQQQKSTWWNVLVTYIYSMTSSSPMKRRNSMFSSTHHQDERHHKDRSNSVSTDDSSVARRHKTPFTKLSSFKFRKELGRGAFGRVLLAEAKTDGQLYALKIISKKNMKSSDKRQAKTERDILLAMGHIAPHPFTAGLRFAFQSENNLYLGMDYLPGGNLKELIKRFGALPEEWACLFAAELTLAISHLHSLNVIYRDIKPHNVMIDVHGHVVLIDFGLSKQDISHPRGAMSLVGTPDYSAPEVLKTGVYQIEQSNKAKKDHHIKDKHHKRHHKASSQPPAIISQPPAITPSANQAAITDAKSKIHDNMNVPPHIGYGRAADWWSLGIMIYEMIGGTPTFRGTDLRQTYQRVLYSDVEFKPEEKFSVSAKLLILGLLKKDPSERLGSWNNPPIDILQHSFFHDIQWDAVLQRHRDGPWIPEPVIFGRKNCTSTIANNKAASTITPVAEGDEYDEDKVVDHDIVSHSISSSTRPKSVDMTKPHINNSNKANQHHDHIIASPAGATAAARRDSDSDRDSLAGRPSEMMQLRDSIIAFSKGQQANRIQDWSFFDESILVSASSSASASTFASPSSQHHVSPHHAATHHIPSQHHPTFMNDDLKTITNIEVKDKDVDAVKDKNHTIASTLSPLSTPNITDEPKIDA